ncbi:hypothetical protein [Clostridium sp. DJ247]|uniref:hypothetical protein n=1 Tax=Clostridium sp. DJ247 TaxID=2726188 RepID=UPI0016243C3A|nr:hypothetical protein [Clostridium sp. DJ247]MBC2581084.1 hypothetical protein [Clostridium sp. DJ247]
MRKMIDNKFDFKYDSYDELVNDIPNLHKEGYVIEHGEQRWDGTWCIQAKSVNEYIVKNALINKFFAIYDKFGCIKYEGINNSKKIVDNNKKINIKDLSKNERIKYLYELEHMVDEREMETIKRLDRNELINLIDLALEADLKDKSWLKTLSQYFKEKF